MDEQPQFWNSRVSRRLLIAFGLVPLALAMVSSPRVSRPKEIEGTRTAASLVFSQYAVTIRETPATGRIVIPFTFWNRGRQDLNIDSLDPSCGCLGPKLLGDRKHYPPGAQGGFEIHLDMARETPGPKTYQVLVRYDDGKPQTEVVSFRITVPEKTVQVTPSELYFYQTTDHELNSEIFVKDRRGKNLNVVEVRSRSPNLTTQIKEKMLDGETSTTPIQVSVNGTLPQGSSSTFLSIKTDDADFPVIQVPVFLQGRPKTVQLTTGEVIAPQTRLINEGSSGTEK